LIKEFCIHFVNSCIPSLKRINSRNYNYDKFIWMERSNLKQIFF
jgi:hypothetical protein